MHPPTLTSKCSLFLQLSLEMLGAGHRSSLSVYPWSHLQTQLQSGTNVAEAHCHYPTCPGWLHAERAWLRRCLPPLLQNPAILNPDENGHDADTPGQALRRSIFPCAEYPPTIYRVDDAASGGSQLLFQPRPWLQYASRQP